MPGWTTFNEFLAAALSAPPEARQALVDQLLAERTVFPWVSGDGATFIFNAQRVLEPVRDVALNLDTLPGDPPFAPMQNLDGTTLWYVTHYFAADDLLDYLLAVNDPMTPLAQEKNVLARVNQFWQPDPLNPRALVSGSSRVSVLQMPQARPFADWSAFGVPHGVVRDIAFGVDTLESAYFDFSHRSLSVYTPPDYSPALLYPLLVVFDGQWATGPLQLPAIADALIRHGRMQPSIIAMIGSAQGPERDREYIANDDLYRFLAEELLPYLQTGFSIDSTRLAVGGFDVGALAAASIGLRNPALFTRLFMISPPMGKGQNVEGVKTYLPRFTSAGSLPRRIFHAVGRYEGKARFVRPAHQLRDALEPRARSRELAYHFAEFGSGHGLVGFKSVLPEALAWVLPGPAFS